MPIFALPLAPNSRTPTSRLHLSSVPPPNRKRKRDPSPSDDEKAFSDDNLDLPDESTNPLSLTPGEIAQYKLAGLNLTEQIPGKERGFPHRALPDEAEKKGKGRDRKGKGKEGAEAEAEDESRYEEGEKQAHGERLRKQHLSVLVAILHKSLLKGDIARAGRAWAMLIRAEVNGQPMDIRGTGYWGIGAEVLLRAADPRIAKAPRPARDEEQDADRDWEREDGEDRSETEPEDDGNFQSEVTELSTGEKRYGTRIGLKAMKNYYERLILQYPYKRQFPGAVTALDFWPAMISMEIYGIQWEQKAGLERISDDQQKNESSDYDIDVLSDGSEDGFGAAERRRERRRRRKEEKWWQERDLIRHTALDASEKLAKRLDELMNTPPYSDSHVLLRIRGMLALYIGDISVPEKPIDDDEDTEDEAGDEDYVQQRWAVNSRRLIEHEKGKSKQTEEKSRAFELFQKIKREGGNAGVKFNSLVEVNGEAEEEREPYDAED